MDVLRKLVPWFPRKLIKLLPLAVLLSACETIPGVSPDPEVPVQLEADPFVDEQGGYSIRYPKGWKAELHWFGSSFIELPQPNIWAPSLSIQHIDFSASQPSRGTRTFRPPPLNAWEMLEPIWEYGFADEGASIVAQVEHTTLAGHDAAYIDYGYFSEGREDQSGRIICVFIGDRGLYIEASAGKVSWRQFLPRLNAMLDSLTLREPQD